jgi:hypothetical protein
MAEGDPPSVFSGSEDAFPILNFDFAPDVTFPELIFDDHFGSGVETRQQKRKAAADEAEEDQPLAKRGKQHQAAADLQPPQSPNAEEEDPHQAADDQPEHDDFRPPQSPNADEEEDPHQAADDQPEHDDFQPPQSPNAETAVAPFPFRNETLINTTSPNVQFKLRVEQFKRNTRFSTENILFKVTPMLSGKRVTPMMGIVPAIRQCMVKALTELRSYYDNRGMVNRQFILTINSAKIKNGINHR